MLTTQKKFIAYLMDVFASTGSIKTKGMFGGVGIYLQEAMFALIGDQDELYLRANGSLEKFFLEKGFAAFIYKKRGIPIQLKYYQIAHAIIENRQEFLTYVDQSLKGALEDKAIKIKEKTARIKDLPNLNSSFERLLRQSGVTSVEELKAIGPVQAFLKIKARHSFVSNHLFFSLAAAIDGQHVYTLPKQSRHALLSRLHQK